MYFCTVPIQINLIKINKHKLIQLSKKHPETIIYSKHTFIINSCNAATLICISFLSMSDKQERNEQINPTQ